MGDVAQILGVPKVKGTNPDIPGIAKPSLPVKQQPNKSLKMQGMPKEVFDLVVGKQDPHSAELPMMVPTKIVPRNQTGKKLVKVGNKWISTQKPARPWAWTPFTSSSRADGLVLNHWVRANVEYPDYVYARFDIHLDPIAYTDDEYKAYLQDSDSSWTKGETDLLMELARKFELRWAVIQDRWLETFEDVVVAPKENAEEESKSQRNHPRRVEDLQHRYYSVAALLTQSRIAQEAAVEAKHLESSAPNPNAPDQHQATNQLLLETAAARSLASSDFHHQPLIHNLGSGTTNKVWDLTQERERRKRLEAIWNRSKAEEEEEEALRQELKQVEAELRKLKKSGAHLRTGNGLRGAAMTNARVASPAEVVESAFAGAPVPTPGVPFLQSGRLAPPSGVGINKPLFTKLEAILGEMKVPKTPLATKQVCDLYDSVRRDALSLLVLQKSVLQKEGLVQAQRLKLAKMGGNVRVVDEETLLGIAAAPPRKQSRSSSVTNTPASSQPPKLKSVASNSASSSNKQSKTVSTGKTSSTLKQTPSSGGTKEAEKKPRKPSAKRKRKAEDAGPTLSSTATTTTTMPIPMASMPPAVAAAHMAAAATPVPAGTLPAPTGAVPSADEAATAAAAIIKKARKG